MTAAAEGLSYVLPLRRWRPEPVGELAEYLQRLGSCPGMAVEVIVVDGSEPAIFDAHRMALAPTGARHVGVDPRRRGRSGKVNGVLTGVDQARWDRVVIADDDVRYDEAGLRRMAGMLDGAHLVRPQNHFDPMPWHARWDTARTLLNRAVTADYPGTLGVRRSALAATDGYDADVLFENLELMRTVQAAGGRVVHAPDLYVRRLPPSARQFLRQRVRQAYDSSATPSRWLFELAIAPVALLVARRRPSALVVAALAAVAVAERGRRRAGGTAVFPASSSALAPGWLLERGVCAWLAVLSRLRHGGVRYAGATFDRSTTPRRQLRRRLAGRCPPLPPLVAPAGRESRESRES